MMIKKGKTYNKVTKAVITRHVENLKNLEEAWNNYQVYLNDEINFIDEEPMLNYPLRKRSE